MSSVVLLRGQLIGMGREVACDLLAWRASAVPEAPFVRVQVLDAPSDLPDGPYSVTVEGRTFSIRKVRNQWPVQPV